MGYENERILIAGQEMILGTPTSISPGPNMSPALSKSALRSVGFQQGDKVRQKPYDVSGYVNILNRIEATEEILCISYTETCDHLAAGLTDGTIKLYNAKTGEEALTLRDAEMAQNSAPTTAIKHRPVHKAHPISNTLTATYANGCVKCWHYPSAQCLYTIREKRQTLGLTYHPHLPKFVTVGDDMQLCLYDEETKTQERIFHGSVALDVMDGHKSRVFSACFNPKSTHEIISAGWDNTIQFWDTRQPYALRHISGVHMCGDGLDISRNGKEILSCAWQKKNAIQLWDYGSGRLIVTLDPDSDTSLLYCGKYVHNLFIACGGTDCNLFRIVDLRSHSTTAAIRNLFGAVNSMDVGCRHQKYTKKSKMSTTSSLPKIAFSSGKTILEVDAQPG